MFRVSGVGVVFWVKDYGVARLKGSRPREPSGFPQGTGFDSQQGDAIYSSLMQYPTGWG